jgi:branched-chain amino acid transport system ATP-binding protein
MSLLRLDSISVNYGDLRALRNVSIDINEGEIVAVIGSNGAGKTTMVNTISGLLRPQTGKIIFEAINLDGLSTSQIVSTGLVQCPEGRKIFPTLTVQENLELGAYSKRARKKRSETLHWVYNFSPILAERREQIAATLSGGEQQILAITRGLMALPKLFMLDEPSLGLAPLFIKEIFTIIQEINQNGVAILLIEQDVTRALAIAKRGYVLENGVIIMEGKSDVLLHDKNIKQAYLGL